MPRGRRARQGGKTGSGVSANKRPKTNDDHKSAVQSAETPVVPKTAPDDDWQMNKPLSACLRYLQEKSHLTDVTFEFPEEEPVQRLDAHKLILAARSPVFEAMFYGLAGRQVEEGPIKISDSSSKTFGEMLKFIYTDDNSIMRDAEDVLDLLQLSHKYRIDSLVKACCTFLQSNITAENVLTLLETAMFFDLNDLKQCCFITIENQQRVHLLKNFEKVKVGTLFEMVRRESLQGNEIYIYAVCKMWADAECRRQGMPSTGQNMRRVLGVVLQQIRFPLIGANAIADTVSKDGVLTGQQLLNLLLQVNSTGKIGAGEFSSTPRVVRSHPTYVNRPHMYRRHRSASILVYSETVKIKSSQDLYTHGLQWNVNDIERGPLDQSGSFDKITGKITVHDGENETDCIDFLVLSRENPQKLVRGTSPKPIFLQKDMEYNLTFELTFENTRIRRDCVFEEPRKFTLANGAEVSWSSNQFDTSMAVNTVRFHPIS